MAHEDIAQMLGDRELDNSCRHSSCWAAVPQTRQKHREVVIAGGAQAVLRDGERVVSERLVAVEEIDGSGAVVIEEWVGRA
jgi:hypothetical protein